MSRKSCHETMKGRDFEDIFLDLAHKNECLEARIVDLETKLLNLKGVIVRLTKVAGPWTCINYCHICGALGDEPCDAGLHG